MGYGVLSCARTPHEQYIVSTVDGVKRLLQARLCTRELTGQRRMVCGNGRQTVAEEGNTGQALPCWRAITEPHHSRVTRASTQAHCRDPSRKTSYIIKPNTRPVVAFVPRSQRKLVSMSLAHHSTLRRAAPAFSSTSTRRSPVLCSSVRQHARSQPAEQQDQQHLKQQTRRALLSQTAAAAAGLWLLRAPAAFAAGPLDNIARQLTRPDITPLEVRMCAADEHCCSSQDCYHSMTGHGLQHQPEIEQLSSCCILPQAAVDPVAHT
jgi:hypothetical protein